MTDSLRAQLAANAATFGLELDAPVWTRLETLAGLWIRYGRSMNLTSARDRAELVPHMTEGLQVVALARRLGLDRPEVRWLDVGAGAGFPGLVIAACTSVTLTMVEPRERRAGFLELALASLARSGTVRRGFVEASGWRPIEGRSSLEGEFDAANARAVFAPDVWWEVGQVWVKDGGFVFAHLTTDNRDFWEQKLSDEVNFDRWSVCAARVEVG
ncbi:MAG: RsmG family class I SAM-dependent methyltransferase [Nannocystaceae bacterium]